MYILTLIMAQNVKLDLNFGFYPDFYPKILPWNITLILPWNITLIMTLKYYPDYDPDSFF